MFRHSGERGKWGRGEMWVVLASRAPHAPLPARGESGVERQATASIQPSQDQIPKRIQTLDRGPLLGTYFISNLTCPYVYANVKSCW